MSTVEQQRFIAEISPFDRLRENELRTVSEAMDIAYFKKGHHLINRDSASTHLYIIIKGIVQEVGEEGTLGVHVSQDMFDPISLLEGKSKNDFIVQEELICYTLPKEIFLTLINNNPSFQEFYYQDLSARLNRMIERRNNKDLSSFMVAKIGEAYIHPAIFVEANATIYDAVVTLKKHKATSVLVKWGEQVGIVTDTDIREHVVLRRCSVDAPIADIATYNLISMRTDDFLFNAMLTMTKHSIKRLIIYNLEGEIAGVLDQMDLLSYFSNHSHLIVVQIERAANKDQLKKASQNLTTMIQTLNAKGVKIRYITQLVNELNRKVFEKLYEFVAPPELIANSCLLVMGSEGRGEQIMKTDQDNAIILRDGLNFPDLPAITQELSETLMSFGYPPCAGNIMVNNPYWSKSLKDFQEEIYQWVNYPAHDSMMNLAIFFDATAVSGDVELLNGAKEYLFHLLQDNKPFYSVFARPTVAFETPLGMFANFIVDKSHDNQLNIKKGGIFPIVHGIRSLALEYRLSKTNTIERIKELVELGVFDKKIGVELIEAFAFMLSLRLQAELDYTSSNNTGQGYNNFINPAKLNKLERDLLKDSLKIVNEFKKFITYHFKLNMVS